MASYQRVALFILFDSIERDLVNHIRAAVPSSDELQLTEEELDRATRRLRGRDSSGLNLDDKFDLLHGLDLGDKYAVLLRHKAYLPTPTRQYFVAQNSTMQRAIPVRNATMHGRPLTTDEYAVGFSIAERFCDAGGFWPSLLESYRRYSADPDGRVILGLGQRLLCAMAR